MAEYIESPNVLRFTVPPEPNTQMRFTFTPIVDEEMESRSVFFIVLAPALTNTSDYTRLR